MESVQNRAIRYFLGVHKLVSIHAITGDVGWINPHTKQKLNMLKLWNRVVDMPESRLTRKILLCDVECSNRKIWAYDIKILFSELDMITLPVS